MTEAQAREIAAAIVRKEHDHYYVSPRPSVEPFDLREAITAAILEAGKAQATELAKVTAERDAMRRVVEAARHMPRSSPVGGSASDAYAYSLSNGEVWTLDKALTALDALSTTPATADRRDELADAREAVRVLGEGVSLLGIAQVRLEIPRYEGLHERIDKAMGEINDNPTAAAAVEAARKGRGEQ